MTNLERLKSLVAYGQRTGLTEPWPALVSITQDEAAMLAGLLKFLEAFPSTRHWESNVDGVYDESGSRQVVIDGWVGVAGHELAAFLREESP